MGLLRDGFEYKIFAALGRAGHLAFDDLAFPAAAFKSRLAVGRRRAFRFNARLAVPAVAGQATRKQLDFELTFVLRNDLCAELALAFRFADIFALRRVIRGILARLGEDDFLRLFFRLVLGRADRAQAECGDQTRQ